MIVELSLDGCEESLESRGESTLQIRECCLISSVDVGDGGVDHQAKAVLEMCYSLLY